MNMEEKLELNQLKHYLGTGCKFIFEVSEIWPNSPQEERMQEVREGNIPLCLNHGKLLLHPLDRLTEPILEGGKIPIIELAKHSFSGISIPEITDYEINQNNNEVNLIYCKGQSTFFFSYSKKWKSFHWSRGDGERIFTFLQSELFEKLSEWHIDWQGLIPKGLALPIDPK